MISADSQIAARALVLEFLLLHQVRRIQHAEREEQLQNEFEVRNGAPSAEGDAFDVEAVRLLEPLDECAQCRINCNYQTSKQISATILLRLSSHCQEHRYDPKRSTSFPVKKQSRIRMRG